MKLGWKLAMGEDLLWTKLMRSEYLEGKNFFEHQKVKGSSYVWQGIISARQFIKRGCCFKIGDGLGINPWKDPWIPSLLDKIPITKEWVDLGRWTRLINLWEENGQRLNESWLQEIYDDQLVEAILNVNWPATYGRTECYGVVIPGAFFQWVIATRWIVATLMWRIEFRKCFGRKRCMNGWRSLLGEFWRVLPTREILSRRLGLQDTSCLVCGNPIETFFQLFKDCFH